MITEINLPALPPNLRTLLSYVTSRPIDSVYKAYVQAPNRKLFGLLKDDQLIGCIGGEYNSPIFVIQHIAVTPEERGNGIGSCMIQFILEEAAIKQIIAETDKDAVSFYRKLGFTITSLGEKYPGVERFHCHYSLK